MHLCARWYAHICGPYGIRITESSEKYFQITVHWNSFERVMSLWYDRYFDAFDNLANLKHPECEKLLQLPFHFYRYFLIVGRTVCAVLYSRIQTTYFKCAKNKRSRMKDHNENSPTMCYTKAPENLCSNHKD